MFKNFLVGLAQFCIGALSTGVIMIIGYLSISWYVDKSYHNTYKLAYSEGFRDGISHIQQYLSKEPNWTASESKEQVQKKDIYQELIEKIDEFNKRNKNSAEYFVSTEQMIDQIMKKSNPELTQETMKNYKASILKWSREYGLSPIFVASMIHRESNFKEKSISSANAKGPLQVVPKYHKDKLSKLNLVDDDLHNIDYGINIGCQVIKEYLVSAQWDYRQALYKYVGAVKNKKTAESYVKDIFDMMCFAYATTELI